MQYAKLLQQTKPGDRVVLRPLWKHPVPTGYEVRLLLDLLPESDPFRLSVSIMARLGLRSAETAEAAWQDLQLSLDKTKVLSMDHWIYKPTHHKYAHSITTIYKKARKPVHTLSPQLSNEVIRWAKTCPQLQEGKLFPWSGSGPIRKHFSRLRNFMRHGMDCGDLGPEYECFFDVNDERVVGEPFNKYRIDIHSLRRFAITFHHWVTFQGDLVRTCQFFGHTNPETTLKHYVKPADAIGLTQEMIRKRISIDEFIEASQLNMKLTTFMQEWEERFFLPGQTRLADF